ncbi:MAG: universal stress protein [Aestuariivirgaceae bacterium]
MKNSFLLAVDGSPGSGRAIDFAAERAKRGGAKIVVAYVIEWSPYSFNTPEENAERHKRREEELERATSSIIEPVVTKLKDAGLDVDSEVRHGHTAQTLIELAEKHNVAQIFIGRRGQSGLKDMLFGSVAANLVQTAPVPVTVVP